MLNRVYQLIAPRVIALNLQEISYEQKVIVRPQMMSVCAADQRYYQGKRAQSVLDKKLPMALIHEAMGEIVYSPFEHLPVGTSVALIPNQIESAPDSPEFYENYSKDAFFLSSGHDGFMRELVELPPDRVVECNGVGRHYAALTELLSVSCHSVQRMTVLAHGRKERFGVWGDGPVGFLTALALRFAYPQAHISVVGRHTEKLSYFTFVDCTYISSRLPNDFVVDHAFECTGGEGSASAINQVIDHALPQACLMLLGVSEAKVPINTRDILEKGMTLVGSSRSGRPDFERAISIFKDPVFKNYLDPIIYIDDPVTCVEDINRVFATDLSTPFKTVFEWRI